MDIRVLQYFLAVAREESITKAAESLHMTQPPLSRQLKDLEEELGKQLLVRGGKKVTLTEEGMLLRKRAEEMVELMEKTKAELTCSDESIGGEIHIGSGETDAISFLAQTAANLQKKYPLIRYHIYSGDADRVMDKLDKGLIDFGLLVGPADIQKIRIYAPPYYRYMGCFDEEGQPAGQAETVCAKDLWDKPLILSHQVSESSELSFWLKSDTARLNIATTYDLIYNASHFVKKGIGYAVALDGLVNTTGESDLCFRPLYPPLEAELYIVWKKHQVFSKASDKFLSQLQIELNMDEQS